MSIDEFFEKLAAFKGSFNLRGDLVRTIAMRTCPVCAVAGKMFNICAIGYGIEMGLSGEDAYQIIQAADATDAPLRARLLEVLGL